MRAGTLHRFARRYGQRRGLRPCLGPAGLRVCSLDAVGVHTAGDVLVVTDARRREVYWARYRDGVRVDGPAVAAAADVPTDGLQQVAGSPVHCDLFALPRIDLASPSPAGLVAAVGAWDHRRDRWLRCICVGPTPRRWPSGRPMNSPADVVYDRLTTATPLGARNWRRNCSAAMILAEGRLRPGGRGHAHPLCGRPVG